MSLLTAVLTSAAIGALISSLVTFVGQYLERKSRREELIFTKALDMAVEHTQILMRVAEHSGQEVPLYDNVVKAETYFRCMRHLLEQGELPKEMEKFRPQPK